MRRSPKLRTAYGPRAARRYVDDAPMLPASEASHAGYYVRWQPMPNGGARALACCPNCAEYHTRLYRVNLALGGSTYRCRHCLRLRYRSQYEGRRLEASEGRNAAYLASGGRVARAEAARALLRQREDRYQVRRMVADLAADCRMFALFLGSIRQRARAARDRRRRRHGWRVGLPIPLHAGASRQDYPTACEREILDGLLDIVRIDLARLALYDRAAPVTVASLTAQIDRLASFAA